MKTRRGLPPDAIAKLGKIIKRLKDVFSAQDRPTQPRDPQHSPPTHPGRFIHGDLRGLDHERFPQDGKKHGYVNGGNEASAAIGGPARPMDG